MGWREVANKVEKCERLARAIFDADEPAAIEAEYQLEFLLNKDYRTMKDYVIEAGRQLVFELKGGNSGEQNLW